MWLGEPKPAMGDSAGGAGSRNAGSGRLAFFDIAPMWRGSISDSRSRHCRIRQGLILAASPNSSICHPAPSMIRRRTGGLTLAATRLYFMGLALQCLLFTQCPSGARQRGAARSPVRRQGRFEARLVARDGSETSPGGIHGAGLPPGFGSAPPRTGSVRRRRARRPCGRRRARAAYHPLAARGRTINSSTDGPRPAMVAGRERGGGPEEPFDDGFEDDFDDGLAEFGGTRIGLR